MPNYKVKMAYRGTNYHGFQRQGNAYTVQQAVEDAMSALLGEQVTIYGCSRTDAGVHAREFYFSFRTENTIPAASGPTPAALTREWGRRWKTPCTDA